MTNVTRATGRSFVSALTACSALLGIGCAGTYDGAPELNITSLELREVPMPLAREVALTTSEPTRVTITVSDGVKEPWELELETYATSHKVPLLGLTFDTAYTVSVTITDQDGSSADAGSFVIPPIPPPAVFPLVVKNVTGNKHAEPGFLLFTLSEAHVSGAGGVGYVTIMNNDGDVVWYYEAPFATEVLRLSNGNLLIQSAPAWQTNLVEIDMLGQTVRTWASRKNPDYNNPSSNAIKVDTDSFHHDMRVMPDGHIVTMSSELIHVPDYPAIETNVNQTYAPANFVNPDLVEFEPTTGTVENRWSVVDSGPDHINATPPLDYKRLGYQSLRNRFWANLYGVQVGGNAVNCGANGINLMTGAGTCYDWGHFNSFWYDEDTDSFLMSLRFMSAIVSFQRSTGAMNWILGNHSYWSPALEPYLLEPPSGAPASFWPYYPHAVTITKAGDVMMFDNHNYEALPPDAPLPAVNNNSRAVEFSIKHGKVKMVWEYEHPVVPGDEVNTNLYAPAVGSALEMPKTGNVLIDFGGICKVPDASIKPPAELGNPGEPTNNNVNCKHWARIIEVTHNEAKDVVFDIRLGNNDLTDPVGWQVYRAAKVCSLYPSQNAPKNDPCSKEKLEPKTSMSGGQLAASPL